MTADEDSVVPTDLDGLCTDPEIDFVVAFGSRVSGDARSSSDLDVAVKFSDDVPADDRFRKRCQLSAHLQQPDRPFVDVSDVDELSLEFAHDAVDGTLVCGDKAAFRAFRDRIDSEFETRRDDFERRHRERIRRIAEEGLRG